MAKWAPGTFGFVCGCIWGDDSSWKIQFLDLSEISKGKLSRDDRFGYIQLLGSAEKLKDAFDFARFDYDDDRFMVDIACANTFDFNKDVNVPKPVKSEAVPPITSPEPKERASWMQVLWKFFKVKAE